MIKKLWKFILNFIKYKRNNNFTFDVLNQSRMIADSLCTSIKSHKYKDIKQTVESISMMHFVRLIKKRMDRMRFAVDASTFDVMYYDCLTLAANIRANPVLDEKSRATAEELFTELEMLSRDRCGDSEDACYRVTFGGAAKEYCYLASRRMFDVGQYVRVPAGEDNSIKIVRITSVCELDSYTGEYPVGDMKRIVGNGFSDVVVEAVRVKNNC